MRSGDTEWAIAAPGVEVRQLLGKKTMLVRMAPGTHVTVSAQSANPFATNTDTGSNGGALGQGAAVSTNTLWIGAGVIVILLTGGLILARRRMSRE